MAEIIKPDDILLTQKENIKNETEFRELKPENFWGGSVDITKIDDDEFSKKIKETADELNFTYSGYHIDDLENNTSEYHFSRYPRRAFGPVTSIEKHQEALQKLAEKLETNPQEEKKVEKPHFRILLGLQEGYIEHKKKDILDNIEKGENITLAEIKLKIKEQIGDTNEFGVKIDEFENLEELKNTLTKTNFGKTHSINEIESILGEEFNLKKAEIHSVGPWGEYKEPAVIIEGDKKEIQKVYQLAEQFHQARIAVEDLQDAKSYMMETKYCEDPDKE